MRTYRSIVGSFVIGLLASLIAVSGSALGAETQFRTREDALRQGMSAYNGGYYEIAIPALEFAAKDDGSPTSGEKKLVAEYYLARIYADNAGSRTDHARAYKILQQIAVDYADTDPDDDQLAPFVGRAITALAGYVRVGLPDIGLKPDPERAAEYLHHASVIFNDEDAQFELAKLELNGDGKDSDIARAKHWLSVLSQKGHASAQAFLADLLSRGKYMEPDPVRALALITVAVKNAPPHERVWIEDIYQNIYCGAGEGVRQQATGIVAGWADRYGRKAPERNDRYGLPPLAARVDRTCQDGGPVLDLPRTQAQADTPGPVAPGQPIPRFMHGSSGAGLRDVGATDPAEQQVR
jgi:hypothetical protein